MKKLISISHIVSLYAGNIIICDRQTCVHFQINKLMRCHYKVISQGNVYLIHRHLTMYKFNIEKLQVSILQMFKRLVTFDIGLTIWTIVMTVQNNAKNDDNFSF